MAAVVIKCPTTGKEVNTGMDIDQASWETMTLTNNSVQCPYCGKNHTWSKRDAKLKK